MWYSNFGRAIQFNIFPIQNIIIVILCLFATSDPKVIQQKAIPYSIFLQAICKIFQKKNLKPFIKFLSWFLMSCARKLCFVPPKLRFASNQDDDAPSARFRARFRRGARLDVSAGPGRAVTRKRFACGWANGGYRWLHDSYIYKQVCCLYLFVPQL